MTLKRRVRRAIAYVVVGMLGLVLMAYLLIGFCLLAIGEVAIKPFVEEEA